MNSESDIPTSNRSKATSVDWQDIMNNIDLGAGLDRITSAEKMLGATKTLQDIARVTSEVLQADLVVIYPYVEEDDHFGDPTVWGQLQGSRESLHAPRKAGLAARIIEDGLVVVKNMARCPELASDFVLQESIAAFLGVALRVDEEMVGVLYVDFRRARDFAERELVIVQELANLGATALHSARINRIVYRALLGKVAVEEQARKELVTLREVDKAILSSAVDLNETLQAILDKGLRLIDAEHGHLLLIEGGELVIRATTTQPQEKELGTRLLIADSVSGTAVLTRASVRVPDVRQRPEYQALLKAEQGEMLSELAVLLAEDGRVIGVLNFESPRLNAFTAHDQDLLEALAGQAAIAIRIARYLKELATLREIDKAILSSAVDLDQIYELILVEGARKLIGATHGSVAVLENGELVIRATMGDDWTDELRNTRLKVGEGITGRVAQTGMPYLVRDVRQEGKQYVSWFDDVKSELAVPLKIGDRVAGVINVDSTVVDGFDEHEQQLLEALAAQASIALRNADYVRSLELLRRIDNAISSTFDLDQIYELILVEGARKLIGATHGSVAVLENGELVIRATMGDDWTDELRNRRLKVGEGITGRVAQTGMPYLVGDVRQEGKQHVSWFDDVKSELAVPLKVGGRVRGVINVDSTAVDDFSEHQQQLLEALAAQAGVAIQNAGYVGSLQLLNEIDHAISSTLDLDQIYELILVEGARKLIGATHGSVAVLENGELVIKATMGDDWTDELRNRRLKVGEGITGRVAQTGNSYLIRDCLQAGEQYERWFDDVRSELAVPLKIGDRVVGVINVDGKVLDCFNERDQDLLEALAGQAAAALSEAETQEQLLQAESIKAIGMATAELTHWIGNRTLPILWAVERVVEDLDPEDESILEDLELIKRNAETILEIKKSLLGSALEFQLVPTMIGDPLKDTVSLMGIPNDVRIRVSIQPGLPLVRIDTVQFTQVLENLIKNALEAMDEVDREKKLIINAYFAAGDKAVKIEVRDNGTGITPENLENIWVPFFSTKKGKGGTGIGLPASAQIISKMHGRIHIDSELGQGTTFTIELPAIS